MNTKYLDLCADCLSVTFGCAAIAGLPDLPDSEASHDNGTFSWTEDLRPQICGNMPNLPFGKEIKEP
ncbi:MAG: hypothetical protein R2941_24875 [Desulfobacterales bacterium]